MDKLEWVITHRQEVTEKDLLELREFLLLKQKKGQQLDPDERIALRCLKKLPIKVEQFKMLLELGF